LQLAGSFLTFTSHPSPGRLIYWLLLTSKLAT
jgi:hypothetical protein